MKPASEFKHQIIKEKKNIFEETICDLLASVSKVDRVDGSPGFPPANQVLGGGPLPRVEALAGWGLAALGRGGSGCGGGTLFLRRHGAHRLVGVDWAKERKERILIEY